MTENRATMSIAHILKSDGVDKDYYLMIVDSTGLIHFANSYLITNLGLSHYEIPRYNFFQLLESDQLKEFQVTLSGVQASNCPAEIELSAKNGSFHWIKWEISKFIAHSPSDEKFFCIGYDIVGKRKVKKMQQVAKRNYEAIMEGLSVGVIMQDRNGEVLAANKRAAQIFETSIEELYLLDEFKSLWRSTKQNEEPLSFETSPPMRAVRHGTVESNIQLVFQTQSGELKTLVVNSQPLFENNSPVPVSVVTSVIDVTRECELEKEVHHQQVLFDTFQNNTPHLSWMVDESAHLLYANASFFKYLNLDRSAIGKNILQVVPKEIAISLENKHRQVLKTGLPQRAQEKMFLADGTQLVFWINLFLVQSTDGKKIIGGEAINITDRYKTEERLQQVNERLKYLSHITTDAIWEWNLQTGQVLRNQVLKEIIGFGSNNSQSLVWWFRRVHPDDRRRLYITIRNIIKTKQQRWESEYRFKRSSGEYMNVLDRGYVMYEEEKPVKMIGSLHNITQLKELEAKLVKEKINHQKAITETIFAVQEKERTRMGHELHDNVNQILSTCKLFMEMMKPVTPSDELLRSKVTEYILAAIEEIRRLSKEMVTPQLRENGIVASVSSLVADLKAAHPMNVLFFHEEGIESLSSGKKVALFRIIQEQVKNVLKYSSANNLTICLNADEKNGILIIEDDGIGFDVKQTRRGIGLSNIYERTKFYDGTVSIKTAPGQGCRIIVTIPC